MFAVLAVVLHVLSDAELTSGSAMGEDPLERRRAQVQKWRETVDELDEGFRDEERLKKFLSSSVYATMRPNLSAEVVAKVERPRTSYVGGARGDDVLKYTLLDNIAQIEKEWKLV